MPEYEQLQCDPDVAVAMDAATAAPPLSLPSTATVERVTRLFALAQSIRDRGHLAARLDPLDRQPLGDPGPDPAIGSVTTEDLRALPASIVGGPVAQHAPHAGAAIAALYATYCSTTGYDFAHIQDAAERAWLRDAVETGRYRQPLAPAAQRQLLERLTDVEAFERFLHRRLPGQKRFSLEGTDMLVPLLDTLIHGAARDGIRDVVMGMAHRGRLNVLAHVLGKPYATILSEFHAGAHGPASAPTEHAAHDGWTGDVKLSSWRPDDPVRRTRRLAYRSHWPQTPATWSSSTR